VTKVHKVTLMIVDFDKLDAEGVKEVIENTRYPNRCLNPDVMTIETKEVEWDDEHPLNYRSSREKAFEELFASEES
jgi:hypothetical protein